MRCPPPFTFARAAAKELDAAALGALEAHLPGCERCRARWAELQQNQGAFELGRAASLQRLQARTGGAEPAWRWPRWAFALGPAALAAGLAVMVALPQAPDEVAKGTALGWKVIARHQDVNRPVAPNEPLSPGDALRFTVTVPEAGTVTVFSLDAAHHVSPFYPPSDIPQGLTLPKGQHLLEGSIVLDDAQGPERLVLVFSANDYDGRNVRARAEAEAKAGRALTAKALGVDGLVETLTILKVPK